MIRLKYIFDIPTLSAESISFVNGVHKFLVFDSAMFHISKSPDFADQDVFARCAEITWNTYTEILSISKGPLCSFRLFWTLRGLELVISDHISRDDRPLDPVGFATFLAACWRGPVEPLSSELTPVTGVYRATGGFVTSYDCKKLEVKRHIKRWARHYDRLPSHEEVAWATKQAASELVSNLGLVERRIGLEMSGGIDSTLSALLYREYSNQALDFAWTIRYPFYEFRREAVYINQANQIIGPRVCRQTDGATLVPYGRLSERFPHAEPSLAMLGIAQALALFDSMNDAGVEVSLNGNGGDTLYEVGWRGLRGSRRKKAETPRWLTRKAKDLLSAALHSENMQFVTDEKCQQVFESGITLDDMSLESNLHAIYPVRRLSLVSSVKLLGAMSTGFTLLSHNSVSVPGTEKYALRQLLRNYGDDFLSSRVGKVPYDATYASGLLANFDQLMHLIDIATDHLSSLGIDVRSFRADLLQAHSRHRPIDNFAGGVLAFAYWIYAAQPNS